MSHTTKASKAADTMRSPRMNGEARPVISFSASPKREPARAASKITTYTRRLSISSDAPAFNAKSLRLRSSFSHYERAASLHPRKLHPVYPCPGARASRFSASRLLGRRQRRTRDRRHGAGTVVHGGFRRDLRASRPRRLVMRQSATRKSWQRSAPTNGKRDSACADRGLAAIRSHSGVHEG
jgi:hypothetical protein